MTYKIISAVKTRDVSTQNGNFIEYIMTLQDDKNVTKAATLLQKPETPIPSGTIEGEIELSKWGPKFKKERTGGGGGFRSDPETQAAIIRQNALTNSVNYCIANAAHMGKDGMKDWAKVHGGIDYLSGKHIVQVATYFAAYSAWKIMIVMTPEDVAKEFGYEPPKEEPKEEVSDETTKKEEIEKSHPELDMDEPNEENSAITDEDLEGFNNQKEEK